MKNISDVIQEIIRVDQVIAEKNKIVEDEAKKMVFDKTEELKQRKKDNIQALKEKDRIEYLRTIDEAKDINRNIFEQQENEIAAIKEKYHHLKKSFAEQVMTEIINMKDRAGNGY